MSDHDNLEEFADARTYDIEDPSDTAIAFYRALAQESGGPMLEIACGTGRVSIPIAQQGFAVTGSDIVPGMLEQARSKSDGLPTCGAAPLQWLQYHPAVRRLESRAVERRQPKHHRRLPHVVHVSNPSCHLYIPAYMAQNEAGAPIILKGLVCNGVFLCFCPSTSGEMLSA